MKREAKKRRLPAVPAGQAVRILGLLIVILAAADVLISLGKFDLAGISSRGVLTLSVDTVCVVLGVFLYAGVASLRGRSGWFLLLFFINHLTISVDALLWIMDGDPSCVYQQRRMLEALYLYDVFSAPVFILLTRQVTSGIYNVKELLHIRTKLAVAETVTAAAAFAAAMTIWVLNFRYGLIFSVDEQGKAHAGSGTLIFCFLIYLPQFFCLIRILRSDIPFEKKLPLLLYIVLPLGFIALGMQWESADLGYVFGFVVLLVSFGQFFSEIGARNDKMRSVLGTYVSEDMVRHMLEDSDGQTGRPYTATVLVADLRGFTSTSAHLSTEDTVAILNHWLTEMSEVIRDLNGTTTEFLGDGFLVVFGAPTETEDHADRAAAAALRMQEKTAEASRWNREHGYPSIRMGIGLSSGEILFGSFGTARVSRLMAIGEPVNRAFAAEEKTLGGQIFITPETKAMLRSDAEMTEAENIAGMELYSVTGIGGNWNLHFEVEEETMTALPRPAHIRIRRLEGKQTDDNEFYGRLKAASSRKAAILPEQPLKPFEQIRFNLNEVEETVYARCSSTAPDGTCLVDITVCPGSFEKFCR